MEQFGSALNLVLGLTISVIGYWYFLLLDADFRPEGWAKSFTSYSLISLSISASCGMLCVLNRLWDFRGTARRARNDPNAPAQETLRVLGKLTWGLFYAHIGLFVLGLLMLGLSLYWTYGSKLAENP